MYNIILNLNETNKCTIDYYMIDLIFLIFPEVLVKSNTNGRRPYLLEVVLNNVARQPYEIRPTDTR